MEAAWLLGPDSGLGRLSATMGGRRRPWFELRCFLCGHAAVVRIAPDRCPLCGGSAWEHPAPVETPLRGGT
jgi:hypothetical protein